MPSEWARKALDAGGQASAPPSELLPQLVLLHDKPFDRAGWIFEIKWDGYRCLAVHGRQDQLISRRGRSLSTLFPGILRALDALPCPAILDGEVVALNDEGVSVFNLLQNSAQQVERIYYYAFDLLHLDGVDLMRVPLLQRKRLLADLVAAAGHERLLYTDFVEEHGLAFFDLVRGRGLEGMVAKDGGSRYQPGKRPTTWLKVKADLRQDFVIVGYTAPKRVLDRLLLAYYDEQGRLQYGGRVGNGIDPRQRAELQERLDAAATLASPFGALVNTKDPPTWCRPELVCEVKFVERTPDGNLRHAVFLGLRDDLEPHDAVWEIAGASQIEEEQPEPQWSWELLQIASWAAGKPEHRRAFRMETGRDIGGLVDERTDVGKARARFTGEDRETVEQWLAWVAENVYGGR